MQAKGMRVGGEIVVIIAHPGVWCESEQLRRLDTADEGVVIDTHARNEVSFGQCRWVKIRHREAP
jgi:hypothetical protein